VEIKIASSVNTFELDTLRASSLYQKNLRVHSITRNTHGHNSERSRKVVNPFSETVPSQSEKEGRLRVNLIHGREGAQYRRVRKIAEESMKREMRAEDHEGRVVKELPAHNLTNPLDLESSSQAIAPRFYPASQQQRTRRASLENYFKRPRDDSRRISINGDELNVRCLGRQVYL
jgi:hypothetical protein